MTSQLELSDQSIIMSAMASNNLASVTENTIPRHLNHSHQNHQNSSTTEASLIRPQTSSSHVYYPPQIAISTVAPSPVPSLAPTETDIISHFAAIDLTSDEKAFKAWLSQKKRSGATSIANSTSNSRIGSPHPQSHQTLPHSKQNQNTTSLKSPQTQFNQAVLVERILINNNNQRKNVSAYEEVISLGGGKKLAIEELKNASAEEVERVLKQRMKSQQVKYINIYINNYNAME